MNTEMMEEEKQARDENSQTDEENLQSEENSVQSNSDLDNNNDSEGKGNQESEENLTLEEKLEKELKLAKEEVEKFRDSWQRERAEFVNYKKRTASELLNSRKEAVRQFIHDLLHPLDNLELVTNVNTDNSELKAFVDGVVMVKKDFLGIMDRQGIKKMEPLNQGFDPMTMEAIASEESDEYKEETVIEVFQPGYYYQEGENIHSIRPARVKVGKPKTNGS